MYLDGTGWKSCLRYLLYLVAELEEGAAGLKR